MAVADIMETLVVGFFAVLMFVFHVTPSFQRQYVQIWENYNRPDLDRTGKKNNEKSSQ